MVFNDIFSSTMWRLLLGVCVFATTLTTAQRGRGYGGGYNNGGRYGNSGRGSSGGKSNLDLLAELLEKNKKPPSLMTYVPAALKRNLSVGFLERTSAL